MNPGDWLGYSTDIPEAEARKKAAAKLGVPETQIEILETGGAVLARERRGDE